MERIRIEIDAETHRRLMRIAASERRPAAEQAAVILAAELERMSAASEETDWQSLDDPDDLCDLVPLRESLR